LGWEWALLPGAWAKCSSPPYGPAQIWHKSSLIICRLPFDLNITGWLIANINTSAKGYIYFGIKGGWGERERYKGWVKPHGDVMSKRLGTAGIHEDLHAFMSATYRSETYLKQKCCG
jgi:hypothetical protein